jgi:hypothetical protein
VTTNAYFALARPSLVHPANSPGCTGISKNSIRARELELSLDTSKAENVYVDMFKETGKALTIGDPFRASASVGPTSSLRQTFLPLIEEGISLVRERVCLPGGERHHDKWFKIPSSVDVIAAIYTDTVCRRSLLSLTPGKWLNDEAIHYYLTTINKQDQTRFEENPSHTRSYIF